MFFRRQVSANNKHDPEFQAGILNISHMLKALVKDIGERWLDKGADLAEAFLLEALVVSCCLELVDIVKITTVSEEGH